MQIQECRFPIICAIGSINSHDISIGDGTYQPKSVGVIGPHEIRIPSLKGGMSLSPIKRDNLDHGTYGRFQK